MRAFIGCFNHVDERHILATAAARITLHADILSHRRDDTFLLPACASFQNSLMWISQLDISLTFLLVMEFSNLTFQALSRQYSHR